MVRQLGILKKDLEKKKDIVIRPAAKRGGIVILDKKKYEKEME